jgi:hypothetical protein
MQSDQTLPNCSQKIAGDHRMAASPLGQQDFATRALTIPHGSKPRKSSQCRVLRANLIGVGFGARQTSGMIGASEITLFGRPTFHARPVSFGAGISHSQGDVGSLGCIVTKPADDAWYVLSACHVIALAGSAKFGDTIVEPGKPDPAAAPLAILTDFEPLKANDAPNLFDAAIARLNRKTDVTADIPLIGFRSDPMDAAQFQSVRKYGARTGETLGVIAAVRSRVTLELGTGSYLFENVIKVFGAGRPFSEGGDSGALVVDAVTSRPIGLIIGGDDTGTFVSPIRLVLKRFGVQLVTKDV